MGNWLKQAHFTSGEVAPGLYARSDVAKYQAAVRTCRNFIVQRQGGVANRPGTRFCAVAGDESTAVRLLPFRFSEEQSYVLELGHNYLRVFHDGGLVLYDRDVWQGSHVYMLGETVHGVGTDHVYRCVTPGTSASSGGPTGTGSTIADGTVVWDYSAEQGEPVMLPTPWAAVDLFRIKNAQSADTLFVVHPGYAPQELRRYDHDDWRLVPFESTRGITLPVWLGLYLFSGDFTGDATHPIKNWAWVVTAVSGDDAAEESLPDTEDFTAVCAIYGDRVVRIGWDPVPGATSFNVYRGLNGIYGFVGSVGADHLMDAPDGDGAPAWSAAISYALGARVVAGGYSYRSLQADNLNNVPFTSPTWWVAELVPKVYFDDDVSVPAYGDAPPTGRWPFTGSGNYPAAAAFLDQRLVLAGAPNAPQSVHLSKVGLLRNFDYAIPTNDDDAMVLTLGTGNMDEIRSLVTVQKLLVLTASSEWTLSGAGDGPITPVSLEAKCRGQYGSSWLDPLVVGGAALVVQNGCSAVRELAYEQAAEGDGTTELSVLATHLFDGYSIVDWAYALTPFSVVWAVRSDGMVLGMTRLREHDVWAWHRHDTDGVFESVCTVPENGEHAVYFVVRRTVNGIERRYVERFSSRFFDSIEDACFLDSVISYEGAPETVFSGLDHLEGKTVGIFADGFVIPPQVVTSGSITLATPASKVHVGLPYVSDLETLDLQLQDANVRGRVKTIPRVGFEIEACRGLWAGPDFDRLTEHKIRLVEEGYGPVQPKTDFITIVIGSGWEHAGRVALRNTDPLPVTVLSILPEVVVGG